MTILMIVFCLNKIITISTVKKPDIDNELDRIIFKINCFWLFLELYLAFSEYWSNEIWRARPAEFTQYLPIFTFDSDKLIF